MAGGGGIGRRGQLLAEHGPERGLKPGGHAEHVHHRRPPLAVLDRQHLGQRPRLRRQLGPRRFVGGCPGPGIGKRGLRGGARVLGPFLLRARRRRCLLGLYLPRDGGLKPRRINRLGTDSVPLLHRTRLLLAHAPRAGLGLPQLLRRRLSAGGGLGSHLRGAVGLGFGEARGLSRLHGRSLGGLSAGRMRRLGLRQTCLFRRQPALGGIGVPARLLRVRQVLADLAQPPLGFGQCRARPRRLGRDLFPRDPAAFQRRARLRFGLPERRQTDRSDLGARHRPGRRFGHFDRRGLGRLPCRLRRRPRRLGPRALEGKQLRLRLADRPGNIAISARLPCLALQARQLGLKLALEVIRPPKIRLGLAELQLGLMAPGVQAGDAGGLLQHRPPLLRPRPDQCPHPSLAHHRRGPRARGEIGEQRLNVARADLLAVHPIGAAGAPLDAANDLEFRLLMERRRRGALGLVQRERHFGQVARGPAGGTGEDHVIHLAAAQAASARLRPSPSAAPRRHWTCRSRSGRQFR